MTDDTQTASAGEGESDEEAFDGVHHASLAVRWSGLATAGDRACRLVALLVLTRQLPPAAFGLVAMVLVVLRFAMVFRDMGLAEALVQKAEVSEELLSSVFFVNLLVGVAGTAIMWVCAPWTAHAFDEPQVETLLRGIAPVFLLLTLSMVQLAVLRRELNFRGLAATELTAGVVAAAVAIACALSGAGVWSLVIQELVRTAVHCAGLWMVSSFSPRMVFSWTALRPVLGFSGSVMSFSAFNYFTRNVDKAIIGAWLGPAALGLYSVAYQLVLTPLHLVQQTARTAAYPIYCRLQHDNSAIRRTFLGMAQGVGFIAFPLMGGLAVFAEPLLTAVSGAKWAVAAPILSILAIVGAIQGIESLNGAVYRAKGRAGLQLAVNVGFCLVYTMSYMVGMRWGVVGVAAAYLTAVIALTYPTLSVPARLIGLRLTELAGALWRPFLCTAATIAAAVVFRTLAANALTAHFELILLGGLAGIAYAGLSLLLNRSAVDRAKALFGLSSI